jgi:pyochelin biosynthetic protein PchC
LLAVRTCVRPDVRLVCFPHAGGSAGFFSSWSEHLPAGVELLAVRYPGRGSRLDEPFAPDISGLARSIASDLRTLEAAPLAFFGHSMGALVAFETALELSVRDRDKMSALFASSCGSPASLRIVDASRLSDPLLVERIRDLGGTDMAVFEDAELRDLLLPAIRSDFGLVHRYRPRPGVAAQFPIHVFYGEDDPGLTSSSASAWSSFTTGPTRVRVFPGHHFYLSADLPPVVDAVLSVLSVAGSASDAPAPSTTLRRSVQ